MKSYAKLQTSVPCQYGCVGTWSNTRGVPIFVEHCCPTDLVSPEYIILINYTRSPLDLNDLQKTVPSPGHVTSWISIKHDNEAY